MVDGPAVLPPLSHKQQKSATRRKPTSSELKFYRDLGGRSALRGWPRARPSSSCAAHGDYRRSVETHNQDSRISIRFWRSYCPRMIGESRLDQPGGSRSSRCAKGSSTGSTAGFVECVEEPLLQKVPTGCREGDQTTNWFCRVWNSLPRSLSRSF